MRDSPAHRVLFATVTRREHASALISVDVETIVKFRTLVVLLAERMRPDAL